MSATIRKVLYGVLAILMILDFYSIFNAGNPNSIFRFLVKDPSYDITVTVGISLIIAVISLSMAQDSRKNSVRNLLASNKEYILSLRKEGSSDNEIADSFVAELKLPRKSSQVLVKRKVLRYLRKL